MITIPHNVFEQVKTVKNIHQFLFKLKPYRAAVQILI